MLHQPGRQLSSVPEAHGACMHGMALASTTHYARGRHQSPRLGFHRFWHQATWMILAKICITFRMVPLHVIRILSDLLHSLWKPIQVYLLYQLFSLFCGSRVKLASRRLRERCVRNLSYLMATVNWLRVSDEEGGTCKLAIWVSPSLLPRLTCLPHLPASPHLLQKPATPSCEQYMLHVNSHAWPPRLTVIY